MSLCLQTAMSNDCLLENVSQLLFGLPSNGRHFEILSSRDLFSQYSYLYILCKHIDFNYLKES